VVLLVVSPFLLFSAPVHSQPSWPTLEEWNLIDSDPNENGPHDDWRDVKKAYYQYDSNYLYLKLECHDTPGSKWNASTDGDGRYKWFIDLEGNLYHSGENIYDAEYLLFVEDTDEDASGEMYLLYDTNGDNNFGEYEPWDSANHTNYEVTNSSVGDCRIVAKQIEMYISWNSIGNPPSYWMSWATDQENNNLDQGPTTDHIDEEQPIQGVVPGQYTLTVNIVGSGSVSKSPDQATYANGTVVTLTATPDPGWSFSNWSVDLTGSNNPETITMDSNKTVTATFTALQYTLTVNIVGGGSVNLNVTGPYGYGDVVELTAVPDAGWSFSGWSVDLTGSNNPETITMDSNKTVTATFTQEVTYTLTITTTTGGTTSPSPGAHVYSSGANVPVTAIPQGGYQFDYWELDSVDVGSANPYTVTMDDDHTLHAVFKQAPSPPPAVGGYALPITLDLGTSNSLIPQIGLASALSAAVAATIILVKRRKKTLKREH